MRAYVFVDLGGPLMCDKKVERARRDVSLGAALRSRVLHDMATSVPSVRRIKEGDFRSLYQEAKERLKQSELDPYDDINRLAFSLSLVCGADPDALIRVVAEQSRERFFEYLSVPLGPVALESMNPRSFQALKNLPDGTILSVVTDNHPRLFLAAFGPALETMFERYDLPPVKYRVLASRTAGNACYVSGEGWGLKKDPETWKKILSDQSVASGDLVFLIDDSPAKLMGFLGYDSGAAVFPICYDPPHDVKDPLIAVKTMEEAVLLINRLVRDMRC
ncbi:MAG: hypothetical protein AB1529_04405 [Candidatus Micrarchaeota archaeon]